MAPSPAGHHPTVVIGSGPAGYTAGIYAARAGLRPLVLEGLELGGALMTTAEVENFPGFPKGVLGPELMGLMREQALALGADLRTEEAVEVELTGPVKRLRSGQSEYTADAVILAMGARTRCLGVPGEAEATGHGLSTCATCDGFFFRDLPVVVVGGGDAAVEEAITLSRIASSVTLVHRRRDFRASALLLDRLARTDVRVRLNETVTEIHGDNGVEAVTTRDAVTGELSRLEVAGVFVAIGQDPRSELVRGQVVLAPSGHVLVGPGTATSVTGVFACGDLVDATYRQAITSASSGCQAALDAERWFNQGRPGRPLGARKG